MTNPHTAADPDKIESADGGIGVSILRILKLLARPELSKWRPIMVIAILVTLAASVLEVVSPLLLGHAINKAVPEGGEAAAFGAAAGGLGLGAFASCASRRLPGAWAGMPASERCDLSVLGWLSIWGRGAWQGFG